MPLTLAHPAAVLPLRRLGLPLSAMAIGSMVPDLPVLAETWHAYGLTHSWLGVLTFDLPVALLILGFWDFFGRDALVDAAPGPVRDRLPARARIGRRGWLLAPLAAVIGAVSHIAWDAFTHEGRWGVRHLSFLQESYGPMSGEQWAQYLSGIVGLGVVSLAVLHDVHRRAFVDPGRPRRLPAAVLPVAVASAFLWSGLSFVDSLDYGLRDAAFHGAVNGILAMAFVVVALSAVWALAPARVSGPDAPAGPPEDASTTPASPGPRH